MKAYLKFILCYVPPEFSSKNTNRLCLSHTKKKKKRKNRAKFLQSHFQALFEQVTHHIIQSIAGWALLYYFEITLHGI